MDSPAETVPPTDDGPALQVIARMRTRVRVLRAARGAIEMALYGAAFAVLVLLAVKSNRLADATAHRLLLVALVFPLLGALVGALRRVPALMAAQLLDRAYDLKDRLANALEFREVPPAARTPMMAAALADAAEQVRTRALKPARALAWRWPAETAYVGALLAVLGVVALVEFRTRVVLTSPAAAQATRDPLLLTEDDIAAFREFAEQMERQATTEEARQAADRFNRFIDQIATEQLDRQEAFRRLQALQDELERGRENDREALRDALRDLGNRMNQSETTRELAQALQRADARQAAQAMQQLAQQLRENRLSRQQRQELQQALARAQQRQQDNDLQEQLRRAREEVERLLRQQRERQLSQSEQRQLRQRQRDLERLERQQQRQEQQRRQLARLDRNMSQAMQDLIRDLQQAAQDLEQGAEDLNRMSNEQLSEQQIADLRQQLEDLRQRMRQQNGQGGQQQRQRLQRFAGAARGGVMPGGMPPGQGQRGRLVLGGGGGQGIPVPMPGQGQGQGQQGGNGNDPGGVQAGTGHDERIRGAATSLQARMRTVQVAGQQRGNGPTRSQVIRTAAQEGFTGQGYRDVHAEYWAHAREVVHGGDVPPGYRSYVRRYFQLIRPRDGE
jgi:hypothetical protein